MSIQREYTVAELEDVLRRGGWVECDIAACNCGSWHHRYGLPERFDDIKEVLQEAGVLNNSTGNLPINAIRLLIAERDLLMLELSALRGPSFDAAVNAAARAALHDGMSDD